MIEIRPAVADGELNKESEALSALFMRYAVEWRDDELNDMWELAEAVSDFMSARKAPEPSRERTADLF